MAGGLQSRGAACRHSSAPVTSTHDPMVRAATPAAPTREPPAMPGGPRTERFVRSRPRWRPRSPWGWRAPAPQTAEPYSLFPPPTHPTPQQRRSPSTLPASNPILVFCERGAQASTARLPPPPQPPPPPLVRAVADHPSTHRPAGVGTRSRAASKRTADGAARQTGWAPLAASTT